MQSAVEVKISETSKAITSDRRCICSSLKREIVVGVKTEHREGYHFKDLQ